MHSNSSILPLHHSDPFDRQIIAQALSENIPIVTCADFQMIDVDQCGRAHSVYTDDHTGQGVTIAVRQTAGQRVLPNPCTH